MARILKNNLNFFQDHFQDFAKILKNNLETVFKNILKSKHDLDFFQDYFAKILKNNLETVFKKILKKS